MKFIKYAICFSFLIFSSFANAYIVFSDTSKIINLGCDICILQDKTSNYKINDVFRSKDFKVNSQNIPNLGITSSSFWLKFQVKNTTNCKSLLLELAYPVINEVEFYTLNADSTFSEIKMGEYQIFNKRKYNSQNYLFDLYLPNNKIGTFFIKVKSDEDLLIPLSIGSTQKILEEQSTRDLIVGMYYGIILAMFFYNLFIYLSVRDKSYLFYVVYIFFLGLTQAYLQGYTFKYLWPNLPWLAVASAYLIPSLVGIFAIFFVMVFLKTSEFVPVLNKCLYVFIAFELIFMVLGLLKQNIICHSMLQINALIGSLLVLYISIIIYIKKYRPVKFFLLSWSIFIISIFVFVLRNFNILPYNIFTYYSLQGGSSMSVTLLSFALADRINILKKEKEASQTEAFNILKENDRLIKEQNLILEKSVETRTFELRETLDHLKQTQNQLVNVEKMAAIGQLTAGIAHEINNPINFVMSNIAPLRRDIEDIFRVLAKYNEINEEDDIKAKIIEINKLKEQLDISFLITEINALLLGIYEGASRTSEIVIGMKNFSHIEEFDLKLANVNEGLDTTLTMLKSIITNKIKVIKQLEEIPKIMCYPGKLNQVFMNIINNSAQAIINKTNLNEEGIIEIRSKVENEKIVILIKDNGIGMSPQTLKKIFDPFFTTNDVGQGTGLGLSISYNIIKNHSGEIQVVSEENVGTVFSIILPLITS
jgi:signal transduction histidine kinase